MANPHKGELGFTVDGQKYVLHLTNDAICSVEAELKMGLGQIGEELRSIEKMKITTVRTLFLAGLAAKHPEMDEKAKRGLLNQLLPVDAYKIVIEAVALALGIDPKKAEESVNPTLPGAPLNGTGLASTATGSN